MAYENVGESLAAFGRELSGDAFQLDAGDAVEIVLEDDLVVTIAREDECSRVRISCELGAWPSLSDEFLKLLLKSNDPNVENSQRMAMRPSDESVFCVAELHFADLNLESLHGEFRNVVSCSQAWSRLLTEGLGATSQASDGSSPAQLGLQV